MADFASHLKALVVMEYPGVVQNVDRMLATLGGLKEISKAFFSEERERQKFSLCFRPDDPHCKPCHGERMPSAGLLIRIKRRRVIRADGQESVTHSSHILGKILTMYHFKGMCDFQYLPWEELPDGRKVSVFNHVALWNFRQYEDFSESEPEHLFLPPPFFSRFENPTDYCFRNTKAPASEEEVAEASVMQLKALRIRKELGSIMIPFEHPTIPDGPSEQTKEGIENQGSKLEGIMPVVEKAFERQPIWSKVALLETLNISDALLRPALPMFAFYYTTGPWRNTWVRFGYDPKQHPEAKLYQTLDFRYNKKLRANIDIPLKRGSHGITNPRVKEECSKDTKEKGKGHIFTGDVPPVQRQLLYQYCDIQVPEVHALLNDEAVLNPENAVDPKEGYFQAGTATRIREIIWKYCMVMKGSSAEGDAETGGERSMDSETESQEEEVGDLSPTAKEDMEAVA